MWVNPEDFEGQTVLIIDMKIDKFSKHLVMFPFALSGHEFQTHYVGDLRSVAVCIHLCITCRAVNDALIDTYQLKSLDGLFGTSFIN